MFNSNEKDAVEIWKYIDILRQEEGNTVTICCNNPDPRSVVENALVRVCAEWTEWDDKDFTAPNILGALQNAYDERERKRIK